MSTARWVVGAFAGSAAVLALAAGEHSVSPVFLAMMAWRPSGGPEARLDHPFRTALRAHVRDHPGEHLAAIAQVFGKSTELVGYHLAILEACGAISSERQGKYRTYYLNGGPRPPRALGVLKDPTRQALLRAIADGEGLTQKQLAEHLGITQSAVSYHLRTLENHGLLEARSGWPARYRARSLGDGAPGGEMPPGSALPALAPEHLREREPPR